MDLWHRFTLGMHMRRHPGARLCQRLIEVLYVWRPLYSVYIQNGNRTPLFLRRLLLDLRDDVFAEHLNRRHDLIMRDRLRRHQELQFVDPNSLMQADGLETALRIARHEDTTLH